MFNTATQEDTSEADNAHRRAPATTPPKAQDNTSEADRISKVARSDEPSNHTALAACEPQEHGAVLCAMLAVVKRRRQRSDTRSYGVEASGGFLPLALCQIPPH